MTDTYNIYSIQPTNKVVTGVGQVLGTQLEVEVYMEDSNGKPIAVASGKSSDSGREALNLALEDLADAPHIWDLPNGTVFESRSGVSLPDEDMGILIRHSIGEPGLAYFASKLAEAKGYEPNVIGTPIKNR